ncbi:MAG: hypothetical protein CME31_11890 [Gimesia sp.]|nr:hypothetical protein [Gimesia sp.]
MYTKTIKDTEHRIYNNIDEFKEHEGAGSVCSDWRSAKEGDWALTDDGQVLGILKRAVIKSTQYNKKTPYVRTLLGTYYVTKDYKLEGGPPKNIYTFGGGRGNKQYLTHRERMFAKLVASGMEPPQAYMRAFPTNSKDYAIKRSKLFLRQKRIRTLINKEIELLLDDIGITKVYLLEAAKTIVDKTGSRDSDKLRAIETLMKIAGLLSTEKKTDTIAMFQEFTGFSKEQLKGLETGMIEAPKDGNSKS